ncbi:MAG: YebC/PmpR family DNA-binding transcriptional regulator [Christensenellaceae bacterium]|jgi:YebC/PmpR family DNA-binding regulatory protein|nr:YebC/PmpR family DNA-binding transcriptional regulator [Christensenellaceae bacterium]
MSGHSKWSTIKRSKGIADAAKGKIFTKFGKEIMVAVKLGGDNPETNTKLRSIITKAKAAGMPNDNITRSVKNAATSGDKTNYETIIYEGYGPAGVAVMVRTLTDNKNRTASNIRHAFEKFGGGLGVSGSVSYIFIEVDGEYLADFYVPVPEDKEQAFGKFLDMLDDDDDVQEVIHNAEDDD